MSWFKRVKKIAALQPLETMGSLVPFVVIDKGALYVRLPISKQERKALELPKGVGNGAIVCRIEKVHGSSVRCGPAEELSFSAPCVKVELPLARGCTFSVPNRSGLRIPIAGVL